MSHKKKTKPIIYKVKETQELLPFLLDTLSSKGRNSVKSILKRGQVMVDAKVQTLHDYPLRPGQTVEITNNIVAIRKTSLTGLTILHEDDELIVVEKSAGLLSMASAKEKHMTAHRQLMDYVKSQNPNNRIFIVHRLDRDTSGVMMFAKSEEIKKIFQQSWKKMVKQRKYVALVEGSLKKREGTIESYLRESKTLKMHSTQNPKGGQHAVTNYQLIQSNGQYSLVEVELATGRKNQIRVHMQDLGHPIAGDEKYGAKTNPLKRLGLHAHVLSFKHPRTNKVLRFESRIPKPFHAKSR